MNETRRTEIKREIDAQEARIAAGEQALALSKARVEQLVRDFHAIFVENAAGERVLAAIEEMFGVEPSPDALLKLGGEGALIALAEAKGARKVVGYIRRLARGVLNVREGKRRRAA